METLQIAYIDFWPEWPEEDFITPILQKEFNLVIDNNNPDVVFHSVFGDNISRYNKVKKIFFTGENRRPQHYNTDFSISFDLPSETNFRLPLWQAFILKRPEYLESLCNRLNHSEFKHFCSFTVSNPSNQLRLQIFDQLSQYKRVQSYGKIRTNNLKLRQYSQNKYWNDSYIDFFRKNPHKFSITFENTSYPYYSTEKIMNSFLSGSIPLYHGDPKIKEDWNSKAFVNVNDYHGWIDEVKRLDKNEEYFLEKYNKPVFTKSQKEKHMNNISYFEDWLIKIIKN